MNRKVLFCFDSSGKQLEYDDNQIPDVIDDMETNFNSEDGDDLIIEGEN